jgi:hypothetical protein
MKPIVMIRRFLSDVRAAWKDPSIPPSQPRLRNYPTSR